MNTLLLAGTITIVLLGTGEKAAYAAAIPQQAADNTGVNKGDQNSSAPTADQAKNDAADRMLMKHIRRDIVKDKSLSTYGHNVKIIAEHGKVTLRGPVHSDDEKKAIEEHANKYAGSTNVVDELTVKGS